MYFLKLFACLTFQIISPFIIFYRKDNKVEDDTNSITSSGIPEKLERHPSFIPERLDTCTVLQEKLDTNSDNPEKLETLNEPTAPDTHDNSNEQIATTDELVASKETKDVNSDEKECPSVNVEKSDCVKHTAIADSNAHDDSHTENGSATNHAGSENNPAKRNFSLPTLTHSYSNVPPLHERLPPIVVPASQ